MGTLKEIYNVIEQLLRFDGEREWFEFKENNFNSEQIGEYLSALSNSAALNDEKYGYLIFGIEDGTHNVKGTKFKPKSAKGRGNEDL